MIHVVLCALWFLCGLVMGVVVMCVAAYENVTHFKGLATSRASELSKCHTEINLLRRELGRPEKLFDV